MPNIFEQVDLKYKYILWMLEYVLSFIFPLVDSLYFGVTLFDFPLF